MALRPYSQFAALLLVTLLTAGCGGGDDEESNGGKADTAAKTTETTTAPSTGGDQTSSSRDGTETAPSPNDRGTDTAPSNTSESAAPSRQALSRQAIASCRKNIDQNPQLTAGDKAALKKECEKAVSGDTRAAQGFSRALCVRLVRRAVPSGPERDLAVAACRSADQ